MPLAALWPAGCCTSLTGSVSSSSHWQVGPSGRRVRSLKSTQHEAGWLCQGSRWAWPEALQLSQEPAWFAEDPCLHPGITPPRFPRLPHCQQCSLGAARPVTPVPCRERCCAWNASTPPYRHPGGPPSTSPARSWRMLQTPGHWPSR